MARYTFQCQLCYEDRRETRSQVRIIDGCEVCRTCLAEDVAPRFAAALQSELDYPVKWGQTILDIDDFRGLVPAAVQEAWPARVREYETPVHNRVYCSHLTLGPIDRAGRRRLEVCGTFLGSTTTSDQFQCPKCKTWSKDHHLHCPCTGGAGSQQANAGQPTLDERTRGAEWQKCPNATCGVVVERSTGCNHFECTFCQTSFCYICGKFADADSDHWFNICPRFGQPGDKDASYDQDYPSESDEGDDGNENDDEEEGEEEEDEEEDIPRVDSESVIYLPGMTLFGTFFTTPGPNASPQELLQHDLNVATTFFKDLKKYFIWYFTVPYNRVSQAARLAKKVLKLMHAMDLNMTTALDDMAGDEPTTDSGRVGQVVDLTNFRIRHDTLRHGFMDNFNIVASLVGQNSYFASCRATRVYRETIGRYMILHAPRFLSNLAARDDRKDLFQRLKYDRGRSFDRQRHKGNDRTSEDELLLHTRRVDFEDTYVYA